eukprot:TRINITY_DN4544_c0_g1_i1.p2 TRINITY_DN4544_c0_g1~~TRINITY_DN4544_c0_g1_i1.p2  ORF type:complete len:365 (+),score=73.83 TRINITY_DN4544_c0_g1_i1:111-1205(+)
MMNTFKACLLVLIAAAVAQTDECPSPCHDISPDVDFGCLFYTQLGQCMDDIMKDSQGRYAYCFCSCGRCTDGAATQNVPPQPSMQQDPLGDIAAGDGPAAGGTAEAVSTQEIVTVVAAAVANATAKITQELTRDVDQDLQQQAVAAAQATADAVATAVAEAFAATAILAITRGDESAAQGIASARAESIATATASAYATAFAGTGDDFIFLEAETLETDVSTALAESYSEVAIAGDAEAVAANMAVATTVAEVIATATASAFARYAEGEATALGRVITGAEVSECPATCNDNPPPDASGAIPHSCQEQMEWGKCGEGWMSGYCECVCGTCAIDTADTLTYTGIQVDNGEAMAAAGGEAAAGNDV